MVVRSVPELVGFKASGGVLSSEEIVSFVSGVHTGEVSDMQASAMLAAIFARGLSVPEVTVLCSSMIDTGDRLSWDVDKPIADKHSTGGVGDKVSLVLAPLLAAAGLAVPMVSGRGLGHTGGTLDKLEAIPGFEVDFPLSSLSAQLRKVGVFIASVGGSIAPVDAKLYALRDHVGCVAQSGLIAASIMSKKLAVLPSGSTLVLDVKWGSGAFCNTSKAATHLASLMGSLAADANVAYAAAITEMNVPCGLTIGNALEVSEAVEVLHGRGPSDVRNLVLSLAERIVGLAGLSFSYTDLARLLDSGHALERWRMLVTAQGGDSYAVLPKAACRRVLKAPSAGFVRFDAYRSGVASHLAGAGRTLPGGPVDPAAGVRFLVPDGTSVSPGDEVAELLSSKDSLLDVAFEQLSSAVTVDGVKPSPPSFSW